MAIVLPTPRQGRLGGGAMLLNDLQSGAYGWAIPTVSFWWGYKLKIDSRHSGYWDFNRTTAITAGTSQVVTLGTTFEGTPFPTNVVVTGVLINLITAFNVVTTPTLEVGDAGNDDEWVNAFDLTTTAGRYVDFADATATSAAGGFTVPESGYAPLATLGTGGGNLDTMTAGEVDILFLCKKFPAALPAYQP